MKNEKGLSLIEVMVGLFVLAVLVSSMMKALNQNLKGQSRVRNDLRAATLAKSKLDDLKDAARQSALAGTFSLITSSPKVLSYGVTNTAVLDNKAFTWAVSTHFISLASVSAPAQVTYSTKTVRLNAKVSWEEIRTPRYLTQSVMVTDFNQ